VCLRDETQHETLFHEIPTRIVSGIGISCGIVKSISLLIIVPIFGNFGKIQEIMNRNTSISLGDYFDSFIQNKISVGRYKNASEVVRAGLRLLEEEENKILALREAIQEGIGSGVACDFDPKSHLVKLKAEKNLNGQV